MYKFIFKRNKKYMTNLFFKENKKDIRIFLSLRLGSSFKL